MRIALDLDGTLLCYNGWVDQKHFEGPIKGAIEFVQELLKRGHDVKILTARTNHELVKQKIVEYGFPPLPVTNIKQGIDLLIDDRAISFPGPHFYNDIENTVNNIEKWKPWWEK